MAEKIPPRRRSWRAEHRLAVMLTITRNRVALRALSKDTFARLFSSEKFHLCLRRYVDPAEDGRAAIEATANGAFDLVLMDCQMPHLDGFEATAAIRAREQTDNAPRIPIIAMTALAMRGDRERCLVAGMDDCLSKPFTRGALVALLDRWLGSAIHTETSSAPKAPVEKM